MLVENSQNLRLVLQEYFEKEGYEVLSFCDGESAVKSLKNSKFDICLLGTELQKKDEFAVLKELQNINPDLPVVFISEKDSKEDKIKAFNAGCTDFVSKPFSTDELLFRIEIILKRCAANEKKNVLQYDDIYKIGDFELVYKELKLKNGTQTRLLTKKETQLLKFLCEHQNKMIPREVLMKEIWGDSRASRGRSLDVFISKLRSYIKSGMADIINVHGEGYLLKIEE